MTKPKRKPSAPKTTLAAAQEELASLQGAFETELADNQRLIAERDAAKADADRLAKIADELHIKTRNLKAIQDENVLLSESLRRSVRTQEEITAELKVATERRDAEHATAEALRQQLESAREDLRVVRLNLTRTVASQDSEKWRTILGVILVGAVCVGFIVFMVAAVAADSNRQMYEACIKAATTSEERGSCRGLM